MVLGYFPTNLTPTNSKLLDARSATASTTWNITSFRLNVEFELRKLARKEGRRYCDPVAVTYQSERMPEPIRSKVRISYLSHRIMDSFPRI